MNRKVETQDKSLEVAMNHIGDLASLLRECRLEARAILSVSERHDSPGWNAVSDCARRILGPSMERK